MPKQSEAATCRPSNHRDTPGVQRGRNPPQAWPVTRPPSWPRLPRKKDVPGHGLASVTRRKASVDYRSKSQQRPTAARLWLSLATSSGAEIHTPPSVSCTQPLHSLLGDLSGRRGEDKGNNSHREQSPLTTMTSRLPRLEKNTAMCPRVCELDRLMKPTVRDKQNLLRARTASNSRGQRKPNPQQRRRTLRSN